MSYEKIKYIDEHQNERLVQVKTNTHVTRIFQSLLYSKIPISTLHELTLNKL